VTVQCEEELTVCDAPESCVLFGAPHKQLFAVR